jgi:hypothetical protein
MKIRRQRDAHRLKLPAFRTRRQVKKLNRFKHLVVTSPRIPATAARVDLEVTQVILGSCCLLMSLFFIVMIAMGRS